MAASSGLVTKVDDRELTVEIAENVRVKVMRDMIATVVSKPNPWRLKKPTPRAEEKK